MDRHADDKAGNSREQPAEVQVEQRQIPFCQLDRRVEPQGRPHTGGQRLEKSKIAAAHVKIMVERYTARSCRKSLPAKAK